jgi:hypothetical protein
MYKQRNLFIILIVLVGIFSSCTESDETQIRGEGKTIIKTEDHANFISLSVDSNIDVVLSQGDVFKFEIEAQKNIMDYVKIENSDQCLYAKIENSVTVRPTEPVTLHIQMPQIRSISNNGTGDINFHKTGFDTIENLTIIQRGIGNIDCHFTHAERVIVDSDQRGDVSITGDVNDIIVSNSSSGLIQYKGNAVNTNIKSEDTGDILFSGSTNHQEVLLNGTGNFYAADYISQETNITINGSGIAEIFVIKKLDAWINGNGNIYCYGNPRVDLTGNGNGNLIIDEN